MVTELCIKDLFYMHFLGFFFDKNVSSIKSYVLGLSSPVYRNYINSGIPNLYEIC